MFGTCVIILLTVLLVFKTAECNVYKKKLKKYNDSISKEDFIVSVMEMPQEKFDKFVEDMIDVRCEAEEQKMAN